MGRCTAAMSPATVNDFPDPVMPSSVWYRSPRSTRGERVDRDRLIAGGREIGDELEWWHDPIVPTRYDNHDGAYLKPTLSA